MKMLISPSPLSRQTPYHTAVSLNSGRWFSNSNTTNGFMVSNKANGNGIKVLAEDDVKPFTSNGHRSAPPQQCLLVNSSNSVLPAVEVKDAPVVTSPGQSLPPAETVSVVSSPSPQFKTERKLIVEAVSSKQQVLESRAQTCLKRLKLLRSSEAKKSVYRDLQFAITPRSRKVELDLSADAVRTVCGDSLSSHDRETNSSVLDLPPNVRQLTSESLSQIVFDVKKALPDLETDDATDLEEEDDDAYFNYKEAQSLTENTISAPVALPTSKNLLEKTPAWRYEQERLSLAARDAYLRLQIAELDYKCRQLSERLKPPTTTNTSSSQSDTSIITHACSSARTRPYIPSASRKRCFYTFSSEQQRSSTISSTAKSPPLQLTKNVVRLSSPVAGNATSLSSCHCSCRSFSNPSFNFPSSPSPLSLVSCISCQSQRHQNVVASQPDIDPETRLTLIDSAFHPKLSKLVGRDAISSTTNFDRLDTAAACLLDHAYSADVIFAKQKPVVPVRKSTSPTGESNSKNSIHNNTGASVKKDASSTTQHQSQQPIPTLPPIPLPAHLLKSNKLPNAFFVDPSTLETASRLRVRKSSAASSASLSRSEGQSQQRQKNDGKVKKKLLLQQKRRLEQRKRLQLQRRKEHQRRKQQQQKRKKLSLSASSSRRSSVHTPGSQRPSLINGSNFSMSSSMASNCPGCLGGLSSSAPCGSASFPPTPAPVAVGSGGFDIDNVVIPPPTPTALLAAAQALAESASVEIATPGFRRLVIEPLRPTPRGKQHRPSAPVHSSSKEPQINSNNGPTSLSSSSSETNNNGAGLLDDALSSLTSATARVQLPSASSDVFSTPSPLPQLSQPPPPVFEDTDEVVYRRRHLPLEQQERARYLAIMQHTIAPRKIRDMAVNARPPSQNGKSKGLSRSCNEDRLRRSSRVSVSGSCGAVSIDPECKPFVFPLSDAEWRIICAEKAVFAQQNGTS